MASCHTHAATKLSSHRSFWWRRASHRIHRIHRIFWRKIFSHGFHGCTQIRRVWHPCHTHAATKLSSHRSFWWRRASHRIHRIHRIFWRKIFSHGFHGCTQIRRVWHPCHTHAAHQTIFPQKFLAEKSLPRIACMCTEFSGARYSPTDFTDTHRLGGYGIPAIPTQPLNYLPTEVTEPYAT